ncbi:DUF1893 domain-containing protein [Thermotoga sp. KOL6]|uniref:DUF1893 domain-containing protein n=1 Tax=Thermotoga sp. KOL6 TaxID=126741 RepID=UPI000C7863A9|nr:DUF1893 domain-containing protein [Thermotoga sp. KOL6]PLV60236.1 hypothetical protein AS005_02800 [Thermotoga sp. KOL6]
MKNDVLKNLLKIFDEKGLSLLVFRESDILFESSESGLKPIIKVYKMIGDLSGCTVIDKLLGKAAAFFLLKMQPSHVHARIISEPAFELLKEQRIPFTYEKVIPYVMSKDGKDLCPFEKLLLNVNDPEKAIKIVLSKFTFS